MIKCPYCNKSYYQEIGSDMTAAYYPSIYKDGVNINPDRNTITTHCICLHCSNLFHIKVCGDEVEVTK